MISSVTRRGLRRSRTRVSQQKVLMNQGDAKLKTRVLC